MASNIDPSFPIPVSPTTASVRQNFAWARDEITDLQEQLESLNGGPGGQVSFASITGQPTDNDALEAALASKQAVLVSGSNIATVNGNNLLLGGNVQIAGGSNGGVSIQDVNTWLLSTNAPTGLISIGRIPVGSINIGSTTGTIPASRVTGLPSDGPGGGWTPGTPINADVLINNLSTVSRLDLQTGSSLPAAGAPFAQIRFLGQGAIGGMIQAVAPTTWASTSNRPTRLDIMVDNGTQSVTAMQISPQGGVGIGATAPTTAGHVSVAALFIGLEPIADYVARILGL